jgi:glutathione peroxidase-family protein
MKTGQQEYDKLCNANWESLLKIFKAIDADSPKAKKMYLDLKEVAKTKDLSPRQLEGMIVRCNYQISLIENPKQEPFSNSQRMEKRLNLPKEQSNDKPD